MYLSTILSKACGRESVASRRVAHHRSSAIPDLDGELSHVRETEEEKEEAEEEEEEDRVPPDRRDLCVC